MQTRASLRPYTCLGAFLVLSGLIALGGALAGCKKVRQVLPANPFASEIRVLIWPGYLPQDVIEDFEKEFGIKVVLDTALISNEELRTRLKSKPGYYDLAMPAGFMANQLRREKLLRNFNRENLPNLRTIDPVHRMQIDPAHNWVVPYIWGATGIAYNKERVEGLPRSWTVMFQPVEVKEPTPSSVSLPHLEEVMRTAMPRRRLALLDDGRFTLGSVLLAMNQNRAPGSASESEIRAAGDYLISLGNQIAYFDTNNLAQMLSRGDADMALAWAGDVTTAMLGSGEQKIERNLDIRISLPNEGTIMFRDCFVLVANGPNQSGAEKFLNFLFRPEIAGRVTDYSHYATTVRDAPFYVEGAIVNSASYFVHPDREKNYFLEELDEKTDAVYREVWQNVRAALPGRTYTGPK